MDWINFTDRSALADLSREELVERIVELQEAACRREQQLQCATEQLQGATDRLQLANEELLAQREALTSELGQLTTQHDIVTRAYRDTVRLFDSVTAGVVLLDTDLRMRRYNDAAAEIAALTPTDVGRPVADLLTHFGYGDLAATCREVLTAVASRTVEARTPDGRWLALTIAPFPRVNGTIDGVLLTLIDITPLHERKEALFESRERFRVLVESTSRAVWEADADGTIVADAPSWRALTGQTVKDWLGEGWLNAVHPADRAWVQRRWREAVAQGHAVTAEFRLRGADGGWRWTEVHAAPLRGPDGTVRKWVGMNLDITERKRMEEQLRQSESRFRAVQENSVDRFTIPQPAYDDQGEITDFTYVYQNARAARTAGRRPEELVGQRLSAIYPSAAKTRFFEVYKSVIETGQATQFEERYHADGVDDWFQATVTPIPDGIAISTEIITERKRAEAALQQALTEKETLLRELQQTLAKYRILFQSFPLGITISDDSGRISEANPRSKMLLGLSHDERIRRYVGGPEWRIVRPDGSLMPTEEYASVRALREQRVVRDVEMGVTKPDGAIIWLTVTAAPLDDSQVVVAYHDITEGKRTEEQLRRAERQYRELVQYAATGIYEIDFRSRRFISVNDAMCRMLGYSRAELLALDPFSFLDEAGRARFQQRIAAWLNGAEPSDQVEYAVHTRDGRTIDALLHVTFTADAQGQPMGAKVVAHDITARKQVEEALRQALAEKETLLHELYHRTKNNMQVIQALLELQEMRVQDPRLEKALAETRHRIQSMALVHQKLYQSNDLSRIDLGDYVADLADLLVRGYAVSPDRIAVHVASDPVTVLMDTAIPCGLVVNELVANALTHAFPDGRTGEVRLEVRKTGHHEVLIRIADNGVGLPEGFDVRRQDSLGLLTVNTIVERQLLGAVHVQADAGVSWEITFRDDRYAARV